MTRHLVLALILALGVPSLVLDCRQAVATDPASRVARIEQGLQPAVQITDAPPVTYALADRLGHYKVPALSTRSFGPTETLPIV